MCPTPPQARPISHTSETRTCAHATALVPYLIEGAEIRLGDEWIDGRVDQSLFCFALGGGGGGWVDGFVERKVCAGKLWIGCWGGTEVRVRWPWEWETQ